LQAEKLALQSSTGASLDASKKDQDQDQYQDQDLGSTGASLVALSKEASAGNSSAVVVIHDPLVQDQDQDLVIHDPMGVFPDRKACC